MLSDVRRAHVTNGRTQMDSTPRSVRRLTLMATGALSGLALAVTSAPALAASSIPEVDEIRSSRNVSLLSNTPKSDALPGFNSDLAFSDDLAFQGNYDGFRIWDIDDPEEPEIVSEVLCPGSQNDISVTEDLVFLSTDSRRSDDSCSSTSVPTPENGVLTDYWEGIKIFDVSDPEEPEYVKAIETDCGSHTHTLVPGHDDDVVYIYVSSYDISSNLADCQPPHDKISIIEVPVDDPEKAKVVEEPVLFPDGGNPGDPLDTEFPFRTRATAGCHDITVFPAKDLAAGACMGDGVLWDISDPLAPRELSRVQDDENFAFWHSATFNNAGTKVVFTDELGGGGAATCVPEIADVRGANGIYDIVGRGDKRELVHRSYYKIPRENADTENCVAHNGSLVPVPGRDVMVQAWYQGGISVFDFTNSRNPRELGWWGARSAQRDRPHRRRQLVGVLVQRQRLQLGHRQGLRRARAARQALRAGRAGGLRRAQRPEPAGLLRPPPARPPVDPHGRPAPRPRLGRRSRGRRRPDTRPWSASGPGQRR